MGAIPRKESGLGWALLLKILLLLLILYVMALAGFDIYRILSHGGTIEWESPITILCLLLAGGLVIQIVRFCFAIRAGMKEARGTPGYCSRCGYDLRASHLRCPECGLAIPDREKSIEV